MNLSLNFKRFQTPLNEKISRDVYSRWNQEGARALVSATRPGIFDSLRLETFVAWSAEWGRSDPRLLEILLDWLWNHWKQIHPSLLNEIARDLPTPAVWGVLYEWTKLRESEMNPAHKAFWTLVLDQIEPDNERLFFVEGKLQFYSRLRQQIIKNKPLYKKWGFIETALPSIGAWKKLNQELSRDERLSILKDLAQQGEFQLQDYMQALDGRASRQSAWRDLTDANYLKKSGNTKARVYRMKSTS